MIQLDGIYERALRQIAARIFSRERPINRTQANPYMPLDDEHRKVLLEALIMAATQEDFTSQRSQILETLIMRFIR